MLISTERWADRSRCLCSREIYFSEWKHRGAGVELEVTWSIFVSSQHHSVPVSSLPLQQQGVFSTDGFSTPIKSCLRHDSAWISEFLHGAEDCTAKDTCGIWNEHFWVHTLVFGSSVSASGLGVGWDFSSCYYIQLLASWLSYHSA